MNQRDLNRVALIAPAWPLRGGISLFSVRLAQALGHQGANVKVINFSKQYPPSLFPGESQDTPEGRPQVGERMIDTCRPSTWAKTVLHLSVWRPRAVIITWWHAWFWPTYLYLSRALKKADLPVFFLCHNCWPHDSRGITRYLTRHLLRNANALLFLSGFTRSCWPEPSPPTAVLFHPFYEWPEWPIRPLNEWSRKVILAGYGKAYKGWDMALGLLEEDRRLKLTVVGEIYDYALLAPLLRAQERERDRLSLRLGFVSDAELVALVDSHDMLLCPYREATQSGIAAFALGRDRPVAATPVGGLPEQIPTDTGVVAEAVSTKALARAVSRIYEQPPRHWVDGIRSAKERYSWAAFGKRLGDVLNAFLSSR